MLLFEEMASKSSDAAPVPVDVLEHPLQYRPTPQPSPEVSPPCLGSPPPGVPRRGAPEIVLDLEQLDDHCRRHKSPTCSACPVFSPSPPSPGSPPFPESSRSLGSPVPLACRPRQPSPGGLLEVPRLYRLRPPSLSLSPSDPDICDISDDSAGHDERPASSERLLAPEAMSPAAEEAAAARPAGRSRLLRVSRGLRRARPSIRLPRFRRRSKHTMDNNYDYIYTLVGDRADIFHDALWEVIGRLAMFHKAIVVMPSFHMAHRLAVTAALPVCGSKNT